MLIGTHGRFAIIPCGIDLNKFIPIAQKFARLALNLDPMKKYILFTSRFDNPVKRYPLAAKSIEYSGCHAELIELKNKSRGEVNLLLNACDLLLLTSKSEGSPQIVKEAMACNCPIISTDVGDIKDILNNTLGCYIVSSNPIEIGEKIKQVISDSGRTRGREVITHFDNHIIAQRIDIVYREVLSSIICRNNSSLHD